MSKTLEISNQIDCINEIFSTGARLTIKELSERLSARGFEHVSEKTLYRRFKEMGEKCPYQHDNEGRWFSKGGHTVLMPSFITSMENVKYVNMINNLIDSLKGTAVYDKTSQLFKELQKVSNVSSSASSRVVFLGAPAADIQDKIWKEIFNAMEQNKYISIGYNLASKNTEISISVIPLQLIFDNGMWELWAYECKSKINKMYNLGRITRVTLKNETFVLPENYNFFDVTPGSFGCYRDVEGTGPGMTTYSIFLKNGSYAQTYATERRWGPDQTIQEAEGGKIISFQGNQFRPVLRWILGWGADVKPVAPPELVEKWKKAIQDMAKNI